MRELCEAEGVMEYIHYESSIWQVLYCIAIHNTTPYIILFMRNKYLYCAISINTILKSANVMLLRHSRHGLMQWLFVS